MDEAKIKELWDFYGLMADQLKTVQESKDDPKFQAAFNRARNRLPPETIKKLFDGEIGLDPVHGPAGEDLLLKMLIDISDALSGFPIATTYEEFLEARIHDVFDDELVSGINAISTLIQELDPSCMAVN